MYKQLWWNRNILTTFNSNIPSIFKKKGCHAVWYKLYKHQLTLPLSFFLYHVFNNLYTYFRILKGAHVFNLLQFIGRLQSVCERVDIGVRQLPQVQGSKAAGPYLYCVRVGRHAEHFIRHLSDFKIHTRRKNNQLFSYFDRR